MNEAQKKDAILRYLADDKNSKGFWPLSAVHNIIPECSQDEIKYLLECLDSDLFISLNESSFSHSYKGTQFLNSGGYEGKEIEDKEKLRQQLDINTLQVKKLRSEEKLSRWQSKTFWWFFGIAVIGGASGIVSLIMQFLNSN